MVGWLVGGLVFVALTAFNRGWAVAPGNDVAARVPRYVYVIAAFVLPALARPRLRWPGAGRWWRSSSPSCC